MRKALGRGLDALIPGAGRAVPSPAVEARAGDTERELPLEAIVPNPYQPRTTFDEAALAELASSIRTQGLLQPLLVRPRDGGFELVAGERRLRAAELAGLERVPVVVRDLSDEESLEIALVENLQREDLSPLEEAAAYARLVEEFGHTQDEIATRVGKSRPQIANTLRLLKLPSAIRDDLARGRLTAGHARALVSIEDPEAQLRAARQIVAREMTVRETERLTAAHRAPSRKVRTTGDDADRHALERELGTALATRVRIVPRGKGGKIEIEYYSLAELEGLVERLRDRAR